MKYLHLKLFLISIWIGLFSFGFTPQVNREEAIESTFEKLDSLKIKYSHLPPLVKELLHKSYEVKPMDVREIIKIREGSFLVQMYRSVNVFTINTKLDMLDEKLDFIPIDRDFRMQRRNKIPNIRYVGNRYINGSSNEPEIAWRSIPTNVQKYLAKRMEANKGQVYKILDLGNDSYKIILKAAYDEFIIQEESPNKIALEHPDRLD